MRGTAFENLSLMEERARDRHFRMHKSNVVHSRPDIVKEKQVLQADELLGKHADKVDLRNYY